MVFCEHQNNTCRPIWTSSPVNNNFPFCSLRNNEHTYYTAVMDLVDSVLLIKIPHLENNSRTRYAMQIKIGISRFMQLMKHYLDAINILFSEVTLYYTSENDGL